MHLIIGSDNLTGRHNLVSVPVVGAITARLSHNQQTGSDIPREKATLSSRRTVQRPRRRGRARRHQVGVLKNSGS